MYCVYCGKELNENAAYCSNCGNRVGSYPNNNQNNTSFNNQGESRDTTYNYKFISFKCPECGAKLKRNGKDRYVDCQYCGITICVDDGIKRSKSFHKSVNYTYVRNLTEEQKLAERKRKNERLHEEKMAEYELRRSEVKISTIIKLIVFIVAIILVILLINYIKENWSNIWSGLFDFFKAHMSGIVVVVVIIVVIIDTIRGR